MKKRYRIVTDNYAGYEVQIKYPFIPFWIEATGNCGCGLNTYRSIEQAKQLIEDLKSGVPKRKIVYIEKTL